MIHIPLQITPKGLGRNEKLKTSLNRHIECLLSTAVGDVVCDPQYGFVLTALKFENFNEAEGTVLDYKDTGESVYGKKLSGTSNNLQTFAAEFNRVLSLYEPRLTDTNVVMTYIRQQREIVLSIRAVVKSLNLPYQYKTTIKVWH